MEIFSPNPACGKNFLFLVIEIPGRFRTVTKSSHKLYLPEWYEFVEYDSDTPVEKVKLNVHIKSSSESYIIGHVDLYIGNYLNK